MLYPLLLALIPAIILLLGFVVVIGASSWFRRVVVYGVTAVVASMAACALLVVHPELVDARFRTYKAFYRDIRVGMTRQEVFSLLERHYPEPGSRQRPEVMQDDATRLGFFMNPERSEEPNCEGIFLTLQRGQVMKKEYSSD